MDNLKFDKAYHERHERFNNHPIIQKRGKLFRNWWESYTLHRGVELVCCPICESKLKLICENEHQLTHNEIIELTRQKYQEALHNEEDNKTLAKFKEEIGRSTK